MSPLYQITIVTVLTTLLSSGCCCFTTSHGCLTGGYSDVAGHGFAGCGVDSGCGSHCVGHGGCLGLGCIGKLFSIAHYGCTGCPEAAGCGETYYHDWISDPPSPGTCDCDGNWTGSGTACGACGGGCGDVIVESGYDVHASFAPGCEVPLASTHHSAYGGNGFHVPGRMLYSTWTGVGGLLRCVKHCLLPSCHNCHAFSVSHICSSCAAMDPNCGYEVIGSGSPVNRRLAGAPGSGASRPASHIASAHARLPHDVVTREIRTAHNRPPHKVLADRLR